MPNDLEVPTKHPWRQDPPGLYKFIEYGVVSDKFVNEHVATDTT